MKELQIVEQLMTLGSKFYVYDKRGYKKYSINGDAAALGKGIIIYNRNKSEKLLIIKKERNSEWLTYNLYDKNNVIMGKVKKLPKENNYIFLGGEEELFINLLDIEDRRYVIKKDTEILGEITKVMTLKNDSYKLLLENEEKEVLLISMVIVIDMIRFYNG
ncbi:MAG: hypothetical protein ACRC2K_09445 [Clostridium sp.]